MCVVSALRGVIHSFFDSNKNAIYRCQVFKTENESEVKVQVCTFYADCEHRLQPVTAGYRFDLNGWPARDTLCDDHWHYVV